MIARVSVLARARLTALSRSVGIGFLMLGVIAGIAIRVEVRSASTSWGLVTVYAVLGAIAALVGAALMYAGRKR